MHMEGHDNYEQITVHKLCLLYIYNYVGLRLPGVCYDGDASLQLSTPIKKFIY